MEEICAFVVFWHNDHCDLFVCLKLQSSANRYMPMDSDVCALTISTDREGLPSSASEKNRGNIAASLKWGSAVVSGLVGTNDAQLIIIYGQMD